MIRFFLYWNEDYHAEYDDADNDESKTMMNQNQMTPTNWTNSITIQHKTREGQGGGGWQRHRICEQQNERTRWLAGRNNTKTTMTTPWHRDHIRRGSSKKIGAGGKVYSNNNTILYTIIYYILHTTYYILHTTY